MKVVKVVQTFKDGVLTSSKEVSVPDPINPDTDRPQNAPKHPRVLNLADTTQVSFDAAQQAFDTLKKEIRVLRKKLVASERAVNARVRERNGLKKAYLSRRDQISFLREQNEELGAKLFSISEDYKFLEERLKAQQSYVPRVVTAKPTTSTNNTTKPAAQAEDDALPTAEASRSIAAKPVKR